MTGEMIIAVIGTIIIPLIIFAFWLSGKITQLDESNKLHKLEIMGSLQLLMSDERIKVEKRFQDMKDQFAELGKQIQSNRHNIANMRMKIDYLEGKKGK